jgi:nucleotide-binding universal stress UspA family protein
MTATAHTILTCVDGSLYTDSVCAHGAWASRRLGAPVRLLHVQAPDVRPDTPADYSGAIRADEMGSLLEKLAQVDEARGKLDQHKGWLIIEHAKEQLAAAGAPPIETLHRRGSLVETITELESAAQLIVLGKRGEHADFASLHLGSNLERVVRAAHRPILVCSRSFKDVRRFVIAYDGGASASKAVEYVASSALLGQLECHLLTIGNESEDTRAMLERAAATLRQRGFVVQTYIRPGQPDTVIAAHIEAHDIGLLVMGAYGHSRIRNLIIGSTTSAMLRSCRIPVLLFR